MRSQSLDSVRTCDCQLFVLLRARRAAHADAADDATIELNRYATLKRSEIRERDHGRAPFFDNLFEEARRALEHDGSARLADGDVCARRECPVQTLKRHQVAAFVNDGD